MSTGSSEDQRRRRRRLAADELEDGECSPGGGYQSSSDTEDYYNRDAALSGGGGGSEETVSDDLDATASSAAARATTASSVLAGLYGSGGAYSRPSFAAASHYGRARASAAAASHYYGSSAAAAAPVFPCRMCGKEFGSEKAVCGHMKVHALEALNGGSNYKGNGISKEKKARKKRKVEVAAAWGVTGRRGCAGLGTSVVDIVKGSPIAARETLPAADADPELVYQPTPISCAMPEDSSYAMPKDSSSASMASARTSLSDESSGNKPVIGAMDVAEAAAVAGADTPSPIPPPAEPVVVHQQVQPQPPPPPPAGQKQAARRARRGPGAAPHPGRQNPAGYRCRDPACGMWFSSHQALGGHVAAHKQNIKRAAAAKHQNGAGAADGGPKPEEAKRHRCDKCNAEFAMGVQLGGHMRKHWEGDPIVPKRKPQKPLLRPLLPPADVTLRPVVHAADLPFAPPIKEESRSLAPAVDAAEGTHEPAISGPDGTGQPILLFGIDIGLGLKTPPAREGSPATKDSSSPSTGEQQQ